ncbi:MAG: LuxR C-terminal-related transcriptional regulator [Polyangiaceae bacterium]|nr:LuxR C-terminal-related transcriptional regulator [Polyangiaceae bacterium]
MAAASFPSVEEMVASAIKARGSPARWEPSELRSLNEARDALRAVPTGASPESLFAAIRRCVPFSCGLLDTIRASRPFEPLDVIYRVPEAFFAAVADFVDQDTTPLVAMHLPVGVAYRARDLMPERRLRSLPVAQALYPHYGIDIPSVLTLSVTPRSYDREHTTIWLFHEQGQRGLTSRECQMLEALHADIAAAVERMRLPFLPENPLLAQIVSEEQAGYVLLRRDGSLLECNHRALLLAHRYAPSGAGRDDRAMFSYLACRAQEASSHQGFFAHYVRREGGTSMLEVNLHKLAKEHHSLPEDVTLIRLKELPVYLEPIKPARRAVLEKLSPRRQEIATLLVNSGFSYKEIAHELRLREGTVRKLTEQVYRAAGVRSRAELVAMLK